jgi:hypothetical protein
MTGSDEPAVLKERASRKSKRMVLDLNTIEVSVLQARVIWDLGSR